MTGSKPVVVNDVRVALPYIRRDNDHEFMSCDEVVGLKIVNGT